MNEASDNSVWNLVNELANKKGITEIIVNSPTKVFVERDGQFIQLNVRLTKDDIISFSQMVASFNNRDFDETSPILNGNLPDGSRINVIGEPFSHGSPSITIRKYIRSIKSFDDDHNIFGLGPKWVEFLKAAISAKTNIIVSGGTGVGKTTLLNLLINEMSPADRIISIEDTRELTIPFPNVVRLEVFTDRKGREGLTPRELVQNTLRMRPDRIIVGEVRGGELFDLLQVMNTGHDGSMSSIHANTPGECISRMENLFLMAGFEVPFQVIRKQISQAIDFIIQLDRDREGKRVITEILEITGMDGPSILSQKIAERNEDGLVHTGYTPRRMDVLHRHGGLPLDFFGA